MDVGLPLWITNLLYAVAATMATNSPRTTVNFDFAWRLQQAAEPRYQQCTFEQGVNYGVGYIWAGVVASKEDCCNECSNRDTCRAWDWNGRWCWVKDNSVAKKVEAGRWSGRLGAPWPENATAPPQSQWDYDDSTWTVVDAPHDFGRSREPHCQATGRRHLSAGISAVDSTDNSTNFVNNCSAWYRKHFYLPAEWRNGTNWIYFEGVHHYSIMWLNGKPLGSRHINGYTSFWHRLDSDNARFGEGDQNRNVLAVFANSAPGSGMYGYHGGGLTRHQRLVHTSNLFMPPEQAWAYSRFGANSTITAAGKTPSDGLLADDIDLIAEGMLENTAAEPATNVWVVAEFIHEGTQAVIARQTSGPFSIPVNGSSPFVVSASPMDAVQLWSVARPQLHIVALTVHVGGVTGPVVDAHNVTFGVRDLHFDADLGFFLNKRHVKLRGFCDFGTFGAVGAATPDRAHLYRAQVLRSVGANAWRMAHNPPAPGRLDVMDRLGMLALDENHYYGEHGAPYGTYSPETLEQTLRDMKDLVTRDRSHPSVFAWNLCNEVMCKDDRATAQAMRNVTNTHDGTRPITMNHIVTTTGALPFLDVQGMSHRAGPTMDTWHQANPSKPLMSTEAATCKTERGVDADFCPRPRTQTRDANDWCLYNNEQAACIAPQVNFSDSRGFNAGTFLWAGFDHGSGSSGGSGLIADWAGVKKPMSYWFRAWWLSNISTEDSGRPVLWPGAPQSGTTVFIVDSWDAPPAGSSARSIHVYSNAPMVRLWRNNEVVRNATVQFFGFANFSGVAFEPGNLTAEALDWSGNRLATHTVQTGGSAATIRLSLDAPSPHTGTGSAMVADGQDVALVRAELLDVNGRLVSPRDSTTNTTITFSVSSGAARILGTISGSPFDEPLNDPALDMTGPVFPAHYGVLRAFVQSTRVCIGTVAERTLLKRIHIDSSLNGTSQIDTGDNCMDGDDDIIVLAKATGLPVATLRIPVTDDVGELALAVASRLLV